METPDTPAGKFTDWAMAEWRKRNPDATTAQFNRLWSETFAGAQIALVEGRISLDALPAEVAAVCEDAAKKQERAAEVRVRKVTGEHIRRAFRKHRTKGAPKGPRHTKPKKRR